MTNLDLTIPGILLGAAVVSTIYAIILNKLDYSPHLTWLTVVVGNAMIGGVIALFCGLGVLPWLSFQLLFAVNLAMGLPIIVWQIGQNNGRQLMKLARNAKEPPHAPTYEGRPGSERADARGPGRG